MTRAKNGTRAPEAVLTAIEGDLRRDEQIWREVRRDLRSLGAPRPRRNRWQLVAAVGVLALLAASFVLGRTTAPGSAPAEVPAVAKAATPFTSTGLESKREAFVARNGSVWAWGPAVSAATHAPRDETPSVGSSLESKRQALAARGVVGSH